MRRPAPSEELGPPRRSSALLGTVEEELGTVEGARRALLEAAVPNRRGPTKALVEAAV